MGCVDINRFSVCTVRLLAQFEDQRVLGGARMKYYEFSITVASVRLPRIYA